MPSSAIFTIVQNETVFLPHWVRYYCRPGETFEPCDVYVLDHQSEGDGWSLLRDMQQTYGFNLIPVRHTYSYDDAWLTQTVCLFQEFLLRSYDVVTFAAADEFLVTAPDAGGLAGLIERSPREPTLRAAGYEVVHYRDIEPPLDPSQPLMPQRSWWYPSRRYSKTLISRRRLYWDPGFSTALNVIDDEPIQRSLWLLHLHRIDYDLCLRRHREAAAREWRPDAFQKSVYRHNLIEEPAMLDTWLRCNADDTATYAPLARIPDWVKEVF